jgi:two-component system, NtrC family, sensor histidine kinase HydH
LAGLVLALGALARTRLETAMNRRILIQVTAPAVVIGLLLFGACLASAWYINRLQVNLNQVLSGNVRSLEAAQELEIRVRQLRFHSYRYLLKPQPNLRKDIDDDHRRLKEALATARETANSPEERSCVRRIEEGYRKYHDEINQLLADLAAQGQPVDLEKLLEAHPIIYVVEPCQELLRLNHQAMLETNQESERVGSQARLALLLMGIGGPVSGLIIGYGIARGLSRSIYQLSVRVQDMANRLEQDVASVDVAADGDLGNLDKQLQLVVRRVEEVAERLQRHQREMLRAEQLSAVGQLAASVAHEIRNPLTSVKMLVDCGLRTQNRKPLTLDDLNVIHAEVVRLEQTVQGLLDFARPPAPQRHTCDLRAVVAQAVELVRARARQQMVDIEVASPEQALTAHVDRGQLCTVLVNLFLNALDAMPQGGRLHVRLEATGPDEARLAVSDTGAGIPPEMAGRLFVPFASSKATGTGLGLSICRRIVEEHDGRITAGNRPEGGARFTITLPAAAEERHAHSPGH